MKNANPNPVNKPLEKIPQPKLIFYKNNDFTANEKKEDATKTTVTLDNFLSKKFINDYFN